MSNEGMERTSFAGVIEQELEEIRQRREYRKQEDFVADKSKTPGWEERCHEKKLFGLCISGGGIRSATFALGVLQGLARKKILQKADYLSTVSGGGYIGSWLQGILLRPNTRSNKIGPETHEEWKTRLYCPLTRDTPKPASEDPITFLRKYSNYLAPRRGFSVDTLLIPMIWSRNMILNQVIIITAFLAAFLLGFWPGVAFLTVLKRNAADTIWFISGAVVAATIAVLFMARCLSRIAIRSIPDAEPAVDAHQEPYDGPPGGQPAAAGNKDQVGLIAKVQKGSSLLADFAAKAPEKVKHKWRLSKPWDYPPGKATKYVTWLLVVPVFVAAILLMAAIYFGDRPASFGSLFELRHDLVRLALLFFLFLVLQGFGGFSRCFVRQRKDIGKSVKPIEAWVHVFWMSLVCAAFTWLLLKSVTWLFWHWDPKGEFGSQVAIAYAPPIFVLALMSGMVLQIGLMGKDFPDASREWLARAGTLFWMGCALWIGYFSIAVFAPYAISKAYFVHYGGRSIVSVITAWLGSTAAAVFAGKSPKTAGSAVNSKSSTESSSSKAAEQKTSLSLDKIARYGPIIAIGGFLIALAFLAQWLLHTAQEDRCGCTLTTTSIGGLATQQYWMPFHAGPNGCWYWPLGLLLGSVVIFMVLSWRVDINEFSMHHFYKNRLVRCYLGASAISGTGEEERRPDWFTGFDPKDDMPLKNLRFDAAKPSGAPYPIVNATVNVTVGTELATQERKGLSWIFTPWYSGFYPSRSDKDREMRGDQDKDKTYAPTDQLGAGVALGTAMAISGAAANPNWGSHSSPQTAFLLTLFNVRLGWWMGNPADENKFKNRGPGIALWSLFNELSGKLDEGSAYLNLSDGGHFENLGMYELIRRRCRYVIAIDGEADSDYRFEGLGGAVRKCRNDFGVDIVINPRPIQLNNGVNKAHCVVGRIHYPESDQHGWLLYIKSSVTGDEPADVEEYRREHPDFPQQSTIEQFFTESQFESYRMLGLHVASTVLDRYNPDLGVEKAFERLSARWEMPPQAPEGVFTRHAEAYSNLMTRLADHPELTNLDSEIVQDFPAGAKAQPDREAVFFWLEIIQLAENIFFDLNLADKHIWKHPAYAGWRRVFQYWASRLALQKVWGVKQKDGTRTGQAENYGKAFRDFFDDLIEKNNPTM